MEGRIIAMALMFAGVGLFGTFSGIIASHLLGMTSQPDETSQQILKELRELRVRLDKMSERTKEVPWDSGSADE